MDLGGKFWSYTECLHLHSLLSSPRCLVYKQDDRVQKDKSFVLMPQLLSNGARSVSRANSGSHFSYNVT